MNGRAGTRTSPLRLLLVKMLVGKQGSAVLRGRYTGQSPG